MAFTFCIFIVSCSAQNNKMEAWLLFRHQSSDVNQFYIVNPANGDSKLIAEFPLAYKWHWLSPDGNKLAVLGPSRTMTIIDVFSGNVMTSILNVGQTKFEEIAYYENVSWSPQSDKFAFLRTSSGGNGTDIFLYDINSQAITELTQNESIYRAISWSLDGKNFAFAGIDACGQSVRTCSIEDQIWNINLMEIDSLNHRRLSSNLDVQSNSIWQKALCNLSWSPDSKYISFINDCDAFWPPRFSEVFVTDIAQLETYQFTYFTHTSNAVIPRYSVQWLSSGEDLFIAYAILPFDPPPTENIAKGGGMTIKKDDFNKLNNFQEIPFFESYLVYWSSDIKNFATWKRSGLNTLPKLVFGKFENNQISPIKFPVQFPVSACYDNNVYWSLDNKYVAYATEERGQTCVHGLNRGIAIISLADGEVIDPSESLGGVNSPIGWLMVSK